MSRKKRIRQPAVPDSKGLSRPSPQLQASHKWILGLVLTVTFLAFANSIFNGFAYDDDTQILNNQIIRSFANFPSALTKEVWFWRVAQDKDPNKDAGPSTPYYRPIFTIYLMTGWFFFGTSAASWHLINVLMHVLVVYFVFLILTRVTGDARLSGIASLLFALHPLRVESVAWISGVTDLVLALLILPSLYLYIRYREEGNRNYLAGSVFLFLFAAFSKEPAVALPVFIAAYELFIINQERKFSLRLRAALVYSSLFLMMTLSYFVMRYQALGFVLNDAKFVSYSLAQVILTIPIVICKYIGLFFWPMNLSIFHDTPLVNSPLSPRFFLPLLAVGALAAGFWRLRQSRVARFAILWFVINLLPVLNLSAFGHDFMVQERYFYVPSIGLSLLVAMALVRVPVDKWLTLWSRATAQTAIVALIAVLFTAKTVAQNSIWKDDITLWQHGAEVAADQAMPHFVLGHKYIDRKDMDKAVEELEKFVEINPDNAVVLNNLAAARLLIYERQYSVNPASVDRGHVDRAIALAQKGLTIKESPELWDTLGKAYTYDTTWKNLDRAAVCFGNALRLQPDNPAIEFHLGAVYYKQQKLDAALQTLERAVEQTDQVPEAYKFIGMAYHDKGQFQDAIKYYSLCLYKNPGAVDAYKLLAKAYQAEGQLKEAIDNYETYVKKIPTAVDAPSISQQVRDLRAQLNESLPKS